MAVDVKTLTIGSHILVDGKRERVRGLDEDNGLIVRFPAEYVNVNEVEPIPITPDLLKELGFEQDMRFAYGKAFKIEHGKMWIGVSAMSKGFWRIEAMDDTYNYENCIVRYLHEAEAFLALHGVELIKE